MYEIKFGSSYVENGIRYQEYIIKEKIGRQTYIMKCQPAYTTDVSTWYNICLDVSTKRTGDHFGANSVALTGLSPQDTIYFAVTALKVFEEELKQHRLRRDVYFYCTWADNRRRNAYAGFLKRRGYDFGMTPDGTKCLLKKL